MKYYEVNIIMQILLPNFKENKTTINKIETELSILPGLNHINIVKIYSASRIS